MTSPVPSPLPTGNPVVEPAPSHATHLPVNEVFGPVIQGEGPYAGRQASFVRLGLCNLHCPPCTVPGTMILLSDFTYAPVESLQPGDQVLGRTAPEEGKHGKLAIATITHAASRDADLIRVNGGLAAASDKRVWLGRNRNVRSGWREFTRAEGLNATFLANPPAKRDQSLYERGYLAGMADGDGSFADLVQESRPNRYRRFRLALPAGEANLLLRTHAYAERHGFTLRPGSHDPGPGGHVLRGQLMKRGQTMPCLWLTRSSDAGRFEQFCHQDIDDDSWAWGYLAGIFDAEGAANTTYGICIGQVTRTAKGRRVTERIAAAATRFGFGTTRYEDRIRLTGGTDALWRFFTGATPAKQKALDGLLGRAPNHTATIEQVEPYGRGEVISLTTTTGNYFADGWLVHNCDTKQTWDEDAYDVAAECPPTFVDAIVRQVGRWNTPLVIISGGEPLLHQHRPAFERLLRGLLKLGMINIHVETNGTIAPNDTSRFLISHFSVSPKLTAMGGADPEARRIKSSALLSFAELAGQSHACLKVVCSTEADVEEAAHFADEHGFRREHLWIMPEGDTHEKASLAAAVIGQVAVRMGANVSPRLHLMMGVR